MSSRPIGARKPLARLSLLTAKLGNWAGLSANDAQKRVYWVLIAYLFLVFAMGGASRADVQSLIVLRPLAVLVCGFALLSLRAEHLKKYRALVGMAGLIFLLAAIHLVPLPPAIWQALPGRDIVAGIDKAVGIGNVWRPLTMVPTSGANALFSLFVPLAALLLAIQLNTEQLKKLVIPILALGTLSGVLGIFQAAGDPKGSLYFYRITNNGSAVGLFSNRNHQAVFLTSLFPVLALFASQSMKTDSAIKMRFALAIGAATLLVPLLLVTGSRLGLLLGVLAIVSGWFIYRRPGATGVRQRTERKNYTLLVVGALGVMLLLLVTVLASRAEALKRLVGMNFAEEDRTKAWSLVSRLAWDHMPVGTGSGSFVELYRMVEPVASLAPVYFNHAHNDWLEVWMTFGVPGILLMLLAIVAYLLGLRRLPPRGTQVDSSSMLAQAGAILVLLFGLASVVDYPLRTPSLACLFVIACCWMCSGLRDSAISAGKARRD